MTQSSRGEERAAIPEVEIELQSLIEQAGWEEGERTLLLQLPWGKV